MNSISICISNAFEKQYLYLYLAIHQVFEFVIELLRHVIAPKSDLTLTSSIKRPGGHRVNKQTYTLMPLQPYKEVK